MKTVVDYNLLADSYRRFRKPDPRIAARIMAHAGDAERVLNVGAGIGSYEPEKGFVVAMEPSSEMLRQRIGGKALPVRGMAEQMPFADDSFDLSMAILSLHHWSDIGKGLGEMRRVSRRRVLLLTWVGYGKNFWLEDYIPEIRGVDYALFPTLDELEQMLGDIYVETLELPRDLSDGFMCAHWRRPEAYLDPGIRRAISTFSRIRDVEDRLDKLKEDIDSGEWHRRYRHLLERESLDLGYRLVVHEKGP